jgi:hypothetical protein
MSFSDDLTSCMAPLPAPTVEGADELMEFLDKLHSAWESSGGDDEMLLSALVAAGAVTGIDEAALATAGTVTVVAYLAALVACSVSILATDVWDEITSPVTPAWLQSDLQAQAEQQGVEQPEATA